MSETKFTPGPWFIADMNDEEWDTFVARQNYGRSETIWNGTSQIADAWCWDDEISESEFAANSNLIAAAPDLYEALEMCLEINGYQYARQKIEAALAKARGETISETTLSLNDTISADRPKNGH